MTAESYREGRPLGRPKSWDETKLVPPNLGSSGGASIHLAPCAIKVAWLLFVLIDSLPSERFIDMPHLDFPSILNLISTLAIVGALVFTGLQVREANRARRDQAAMAVIQTSLSENSARVLALLGDIPEGASVSAVESLDQATRGAVVEFGLRLEVIGYMAFRGLVDLKTVNDLAGGVVLAYWSRIGSWAAERRTVTGHDEFLEWCQWLADRVSRQRAMQIYKPAYIQYADSRIG